MVMMTSCEFFSTFISLLSSESDIDSEDDMGIQTAIEASLQTEGYAL